MHAEAGRRNLRFLVIGGLAINHYGYSRETGDLDLLIQEPDRILWMEMLRAFDYAELIDRGPFIQYPAPKSSPWPLDLMIVKEATFKAMFNESQSADLYNVPSRVPSLKHLIALKLHALKNTRMQRFLKDYLDVEYLIRINGLDIGSEEMKELFVKYGTQELYEKISRTLAGK
jgi:hypothetical protein